MHIERECEYCKIAFYRKLCVVLDDRGKFCSKKCKHKAQKEFPKYRLIINNMAKIKKGSKDSIETINKKIISRKLYTQKLIGNRVNGHNGYIMVYDPNHFTHEYNNYVREHRYVIEKLLNRPLKSNEHVHHINFNKKDNRIKNLMVLNSNSAHQRMNWGKKVYKNEIVFDGRLI